MKKKSYIISLFLFLILNSVFTETPQIQYEVINKTELKLNPYNDASILTTLNKGDILSNNKEHRVDNDEHSNTNYIKLQYNGERGRVNVEDIKIYNSVTASGELKNKNWVAKHAVDALFKKDINIVFENEGDIPSYAANTFTDFGDIEPIEYYMDVPTLRVTNVDIQISFSLNYYYGVFTKIKDNEYETYSLPIWNKGPGKCLENLKNNKTYYFTFKLDGDYLDVYVNSQYLITYVNVEKNISEQYLNFVKSKSYSLDNIKWPRHADGTCDYEKGKILVATSSSATNVNVNKIMSVKENLKLRSAEATTSTVLNVMAAGTKVKVLELGKAETIDGINSNWVKVEIISGKDRNGNVIRSGTTGWCYGGYLQ